MTLAAQKTLRCIDVNHLLVAFRPLWRLLTGVDIPGSANTETRDQTAKSLFEEFQSALTPSIIDTDAMRHEDAEQDNVNKVGDREVIDCEANDLNNTRNVLTEGRSGKELRLTVSPTKISIGHQGWVTRVSLAKPTKAHLSSPLYSKPSGATVPHCEKPRLPKLVRRSPLFMQLTGRWLRFYKKNDNCSSSDQTRGQARKGRLRLELDLGHCSPRTTVCFLTSITCTCNFLPCFTILSKKNYTLRILLTEQVSYIRQGQEMYGYLSDTLECAFEIKGRRVDRGHQEATNGADIKGENVRVVLEAEDAESASLWMDLLRRAIDEQISDVGASRSV